MGSDVSNPLRFRFELPGGCGPWRWCVVGAADAHRHGVFKEPLNRRATPESELHFLFFEKYVLTNPQRCFDPHMEAAHSML